MKGSSNHVKPPSVVFRKYSVVASEYGFFWIDI